MQTTLDHLLSQLDNVFIALTSHARTSPAGVYLDSLTSVIFPRNIYNLHENPACPLEMQREHITANVFFFVFFSFFATGILPGCRMRSLIPIIEQITI